MDGRSAASSDFLARMIAPETASTEPYPGFPTDLQAQFMALMCCAEGERRDGNPQRGARTGGGGPRRLSQTPWGRGSKAPAHTVS
ncbi:hypothetical protein MESS2_70031 [Mesorhizobium metallidurans STM 2683]|uniref:Uncharacterized protein n=1 Tax=Mesorhizobium metallidurans STM 2683 TaxID=1297569 RepID=M5ESY1_9HYPH|nr:hypothetical protein MESS2_70031 [Mesorhizobium metallidurans STM 2683]